MVVLLKDAHLVLFFSRGVSLQVWEEIGSFDREVALYRSLRHHLGAVTFVTHGDAGDMCFAERLPGIHILCNRWKLPGHLYELLLPILHGSTFRRASILKTNQANVGHLALLVKRMYRKTLIVRCGFMWAEFAAREFGVNSRMARKVKRREGRVFRSADRVVVTTEQMRCYVMDHYGLPSPRVTIIPNYVDTDQFKPQPDICRRRTICFIGRLEAQKNLGALLEAVKGLTEVQLTIIGSGAFRDDLLALTHEHGVDVHFLGNVPYSMLPEHLNQAEVFVLPSLYEGHPKALLEAMACGRPVIGTDVVGIRELIRHRKTGYLCGTSTEEIRSALETVLGDAALRQRMGRQARAFVVENFSLDQIMDMELKLLRMLVTGVRE